MGVHRTPGWLAYYYLSLAHNRGQDIGAATAARTAFFQKLRRWRVHLETHPTQAAAIDSLLARWQQQANEGTVRAEDMELATLLQHYVAAPLAPFYRGATLFFLGYHERASDELQQALAQLEQPLAPSLAPYFLGLAYRRMGQNRAASVQLEHFLQRPPPGETNAWRLEQARQVLADLYRTLGETEKLRVLRQLTPKIVPGMRVQHKELIDDTTP